jgi:hypothetical protein
MSTVAELEANTLPPDDWEDESLTEIAMRRDEELESGKVQPLTKEELFAGLNYKPTLLG